MAEHGAFNISLINDLPLFIDPFLLFNSGDATYQQLHEGIITYLKFLRDQSARGALPEGQLKAWFMFPEVRHTEWCQTRLSVFVTLEITSSACFTAIAAGRILEGLPAL